MVRSVRRISPIAAGEESQAQKRTTFFDFSYGEGGRGCAHKQDQRAATKSHPATAIRIRHLGSHPSSGDLPYPLLISGAHSSTDLP